MNEPFQLLCSLEEEFRELLPTLDSTTPFKAMVIDLSVKIFDIQDHNHLHQMIIELLYEGVHMQVPG